MGRKGGRVKPGELWGRLWCPLGGRFLCSETGPPHQPWTHAQTQREREREREPHTRSICIERGPHKNEKNRRKRRRLKYIMKSIETPNTLSPSLFSLVQPKLGMPPALWSVGPASVSGLVSLVIFLCVIQVDIARFFCFFLHFFSFLSGT